MHRIACTAPHAPNPVSPGAGAPALSPSYAPRQVSPRCASPAKKKTRIAAGQVFWRPTRKIDSAAPAVSRRCQSSLLHEAAAEAAEVEAIVQTGLDGVLFVAE